MKFRTIAVVLAFALAAWLPVAVQQAAGQSTPQPATAQDSDKDAAKHSCCCSHETHNADSTTANHDDHAASCCQAKDGKEVSCCSKDSKDSKKAMTCCKDKDAKLCAAKDGK